MLEQRYAEMKDILSIFSSGLQAYYKGDFKQAREIFASITEKDPVARAYMKKCEQLMADPPEAWAGVWVMTTK
jgi:hypothetical protein